MDLSPGESAYWRQFDTSLASALKCARIDQRALHPGGIYRGDFNEHPTDYLGTVLWLLDDETQDHFEQVNQEIAAEQGAGPQRKLKDYA